jgi:TonB family protein
MTAPSNQLMRMFWLSTGLHLAAIAFFILISQMEWRHPVAVPKPLTVQWVNLQKQAPEPRKEVNPEPKKSAPAALPELPSKRLPAPSRVKKKSVTQPERARPVKIARKPEAAPAAEKGPEPAPEKPVRSEVKPEEKPLSPEPQKIEIAPISEIDPTYLERVKRTVDMNFNPPELQGSQKEATVSFEILKNGLIRNPRIVKSSRDTYFDMAALRAIMESRRFGQLPPDYPSLSVEITCTFSQNKGL